MRIGSRRLPAAILSGALALGAAALAARGRDDEAADAKLPEGDAGIAARYPGDAGIADDPRVLLAESFETASPEGRLDLADLEKRWKSVKNPEGRALALVDDVPARAAGKRALQITATRGEDTGGHLYTTLPRAVERCFARFHVKFPEPRYIHHFVHLGGYEPATPWPQGGAGERPAGGERMTVGIEPHGDWGRHPPPGAWAFYSYWHEMLASPDGKFWGNVHRTAEPARVPAGRWQCVEVMMKLNSFDDAGAPRRDGELALWLDGALVARYRAGALGRANGKGIFELTGAPGDGVAPLEGIAWRKDPKLKINFFWLLHYVTDGALRQNRVKEEDRPEQTRVVFDDIVVATDYVGPIAAAKGEGGGGR